MKVRIELTVIVDPSEWAETYGMDLDAANIRDDVKRWVSTAVGGHPEGLIELADGRAR